MQGNRGAHSLRCWATAVRAVRPASPAASARPEQLEASSSRCTEPALSRVEKAFQPAPSFLKGNKNPMFGKARVAHRKVTACSKQMRALRRSAKPNARGRAGTSCCAARAGGVRLLASGATQRTMRAGSVPQSALPNPSIERTNNGGSSFTAFAEAQPPLFASHLKR
jgi:hypothetical protein